MLFFHAKSVKSSFISIYHYLNNFFHQKLGFCVKSASRLGPVSPGERSKILKTLKDGPEYVSLLCNIGQKVFNCDFLPSFKYLFSSKILIFC